ncbi:lipase 3 isoform X2 [Diabrotica virgifera virgifera]|uniref:Partial AB-hydrolase lipase domain-containing protein n=1 Tax=Diabrotica virgifera virgifera TaxID=50390 RepID=A0ABM5KHZ5_DIAVI|nr:lipase 3 isoform X2 [Diabrotica virgifera virgifera]
MNTTVILLILGISTVVAYDIAQNVRSFGYTFDKFEVTTEDGYILEIHRISESPNGIKNKKRPPVLVMHGLLGCSADFIHIGPGKALPLRLSDEGYDVWLGNNRGNTYSQKHSSTTIKNASFWDFSFHEIGVRDTPAVIDFILDKTGEKTLSYVAHSTGVAQFLIATSMKPEYQNKVKIAAALAPVVYLDHSTNFLLKMVTKDNYAQILAAEESAKATVILDHNSIIWDLGLGAICGMFKELCADLIFLLTGFDTDQLDRSSIIPFFSSFPAGISVKELNHVLQWKMNGLFSQYDYGMIKNKQIYNSIKPPIYDLSNVTVPVALFYGQNDLISTSALNGKIRWNENRLNR